MGLSRPEDFQDEVDVPWCLGYFMGRRTHDVPANQTAETLGAYADGPSLTALKENDVLVALVGATGSGKTSFINAAIAETQPVSDDGSLEPCTDKIRAIRYPLRESDRALVFLDTPGFHHEDLPDNDIKNDVIKCLRRIRDKHVRLAGVLYFHKISENRVSGTSLEHMLSLQKMSRKSIAQNILLVTTMWEEVEKHTGDERMKELAEYVWKPLVERGLALEAFDNTRKSARDILQKFLPVDIASEMKD